MTSVSSTAACIKSSEQIAVSIISDKKLVEIDCKIMAIRARAWSFGPLEPVGQKRSRSLHGRPEAGHYSTDTYHNLYVITLHMKTDRLKCKFGAANNRG